MGDEQQRQAQRFLELVKQVHHLRLNRYVQGRDGFVAHDELRLENKCSRNADALPLPARELVRIARHVIGIEAHAAQPVARFLSDVGSGKRGVELDPFADDLAHRHARIQGRVRILEDHLHPAGVALKVRRLVLRWQRLAIVGDDTAGLVVQAKHGLAECGLARAALAH